MTEQLNVHTVYIHKEYIYSVVYGALFYTALVTLVSTKIFILIDPDS